MASMKRCPSCGTLNTLDRSKCIDRVCRADLKHADFVDPTNAETTNAEPVISDVALDATPKAIPSAPQVAEPRTSPNVWTCVECGLGGNAVALPNCLRCDAPRPVGIGVAAATFALRLPFDVVPLRDITRIGRDAAWSSLAARLQAYDMLSRRHAELRVREGRLFVVDVGSTHGVRVNDTPLSLHSEAELRPGDRVAFSRQLIGEIEIAVREPVQ
jgi:hypothetical protein